MSARLGARLARLERAAPSGVAVNIHAFPWPLTPAECEMLRRLSPIDQEILRLMLMQETCWEPMRTLGRALKALPDTEDRWERFQQRVREREDLRKCAVVLNECMERARLQAAATGWTGRSCFFAIDVSTTTVDRGRDGAPLTERAAASEPGEPP